jgi:hypothetical protein
MRRGPQTDSILTARFDTRAYSTTQRRALGSGHGGESQCFLFWTSSRRHRIPRNVCGFTRDGVRFSFNLMWTVAGMAGGETPPQVPTPLQTHQARPARRSHVGRAACASPPLHGYVRVPGGGRNLGKAYPTWRADLRDTVPIRVADAVLFHEHSLADIDASNRWRKGTARSHLAVALKHFAALRGNVPRGVLREWKYRA